MPELSSITQISSGGTSVELSQGTLQFLMLTESGEPDKLQFSTNITKLATDTDTESQDMCLGMVLRTNQSCHILLMLVLTLSMVHSRETATLLLSLSERI